jgi:hypothetical protein
VRGNKRSHSDETGEIMAGKHSATKTQRRQTEAFVWLGTGAVSLALGVALTGGSGVAHADTTNSTVSGSHVSPPGNSAATTRISTTISAQSVNTSTYSSTPKPAGDEKTATSSVSTSERVVRNQDQTDQTPLIFHNNPGPAPTLAETVIGLNQGGGIPFIELGGGRGGLLSTIAHALSGGFP